MTQHLEELLTELGKRFGKTTRWKALCKEHNAATDKERIKLAEQVLEEWSTGTVAELYSHRAKLNGASSISVDEFLKGARQTSEVVVEEVDDVAVQAEAQFNSYRAALEEKKWGDALAAIQIAASMDSQRFAPFPMQRYQAKEILGVGGFGTAFLCIDRLFNTEVVVKTLHDSAMERSVTEWFSETQVFQNLHNPAIIGVRDCNYADLTLLARPYIVMDYLPGGGPENLIQQSSILSIRNFQAVARQIVQGMKAVPQQYMHMDLKPDNILFRKEGSNWRVTFVDFGSSFREQIFEPSMAARLLSNTTPEERIGEKKVVRAVPHWDAYAFVWLCCFSQLKTIKPKQHQFSDISEALAEMLTRCTELELTHHLPSVDPLLQLSEGIALIQTVQRKEKELHQEAELERENREQNEVPQQGKETGQRNLGGLRTERWNTYPQKTLSQRQVIETLIQNSTSDRGFQYVLGSGSDSLKTGGQTVLKILPPVPPLMRAFPTGFPLFLGIRTPHNCWAELSPLPPTHLAKVHGVEFEVFGIDTDNEKAAALIHHVVAKL